MGDKSLQTLLITSRICENLNSKHRYIEMREAGNLALKNNADLTNMRLIKKRSNFKVFST